MENKETKFTINMTKDEMIRFYENKIVEDGIRDCSEFNTSCYLTEYGDGIDLSRYKKEILEQLYRDERIADVTINDELCIDMVFWTNYCPYFYDEIEDIYPDEEKQILSDFYYHCNSMIMENGYSSIRELINSCIDIYTNSDEQKRHIYYNILKKNMIEIGFIDKYIESNNESYVTLENKKEFESLLEARINELDKQYQDEFE